MEIESKTNQSTYSETPSFIAFIIVKIDKKIFKNFICLYAKLRKREWLINEMRNAK